MAQQARSGSGDAVAVQSASVQTLPNENGFCPVAVGTWFFALGGEASPLTSCHLRWDAALVGTITLWDANLPPYKTDMGNGTVDISLFDVSAGAWVQENPTTAYVGISPAGAGTATNLTIAIPGGTAGGAMIHMGNFGAKRARIQLVVSTAGLIRVSPHGKS